MRLLLTAFKDQNAWEQRKLGEIADFNPKEDLPLTFEYVDLESVSGTTMIAHRTEQKSSAPSRAQRLARLGDLFYQNVRPYQKNNYLLDKNDHTYVFSTGYTQMRPIINGYFLLTLVQRQNFVDKVLKRCTGTSYPAINSKNLSRIKVLIPSTSVNFHSGILDKADMNRSDTNEAEKIGQLFQSLDKTITLHEEKQRQLEQLKKALLQKMFADETGYPALRFKGFTAKWEQRKLGEIASMHARIGWQGLKTSEFLETGDYYLITGTDFENGHVNLGKAHYIDKSRYDMDQKLKLKNGDILITKDGTIGKVAYLENLDKPGTLNAGVFIVRPIKKSVYKQYLFQYLAAPFLLKYAKSHSTGGTIQHLNQGIIKNFPVALPSTEEQLVISKFLKYISKTITLHDKKIQYLKQLKRGLLQKMFV